MVSQKQMALDCITEFGSITPLDAFRGLGIARLSSLDLGTMGTTYAPREGTARTDMVSR